MAYNPITLSGPFTLGQVVPITFDLEKPEDLYITVDGVVVSSSTYTWNTSTSIQLGGTFPLSGLSASFSRRSDSSYLPGLLVGGAALDYDLINANDTRLLMLAQEVRNNADSAVAVVLDAQDDVTAKYTEIDTKHGDVVVKHADVVTKHSDVVTKSADVTSKYNQVNTWQGQVASNKAAAEAAQVAAQAAASSALSAFDNFDDRFLGAKASDPSTDNDGNALTDGILYYNTASGVMKVYGGGLWRSAYVSADGVVLLANNLGDIPDKAVARANLGVTAALATKANLSGGKLVDGEFPQKYNPSLLYLGASVDPNTLVTSGWHGTIGLSNSNLPQPGYFNIENIGAAGSFTTQIAWPYSNDIVGNGLWLRGTSDGGANWTGWQQIYYANQQDARYARLGAANTFAGTQWAQGGVDITEGVVLRWRDVSGSTKGVVYTDATGAMIWYGQTGYLANSSYMHHTTSGQFVIGGVGGGAVHHDGNASRGAPDAVLQDQKAQNTAAQSLTTGTWTVRNINTEVRDPFGLVSLSSNQMTFTVAGWVEWETVGSSMGQTQLWNVTDGVAAGLGISTNTGLLVGGAPVIAGKVYELRHNQNTTAAAGGARNVGTEVYTHINFWRS